MTFSLGSQGHSLGFYYNLNYYIIGIPLGLLVILFLGYNVIVAFATNWIYRNAWQKKIEVPKGAKDIEKKLKDVITNLPTSNAWEEIFLVNLKIARYFLGSSVDLKLENGYLFMHIQDFIVYMPLAMVYIQVAQLAVIMLVTVLFIEHLVIKVTHACTLGRDCFDFSETNFSATPLNCSDIAYLNSENITHFTCFEITFDPAISAAVAGGFLKLVPGTIFATTSYQYLQLIMVKFRAKHLVVDFITHIILAVIFEIVFIGLGVAVLFAMLYDPTLYKITFHPGNPIKRITFIFIFVMYFMMASFLWFLLPLAKGSVRFKDGAWKKPEPSTTESEMLIPS